jgi:twitching motility protein PilT
LHRSNEAARATGTVFASDVGAWAGQNPNLYAREILAQTGTDVLRPTLSRFTTKRQTPYVEHRNTLGWLIVTTEQRPLGAGSFQTMRNRGQSVALRPHAAERSRSAPRIAQRATASRRASRGASETARSGRAPRYDLAQRTLTDYLELVRARDAEELVLAPGRAPAMRVADALEILDEPPLDTDRMDRLIAEVFPEPALQKARSGRALTATVHLGTRRFRLQLTPSLSGFGLVCRALDADPGSREHRLPVSVAQLADLKRGLVVVAGARPSCRGEVLALLVDHINRRHARHVVTIERQVQYEHRSRRSLISQREVGAHTESFGQALRAAVRSDADVIVVGELSDPEAIATAVLAAETGHLVLCSLHAREPVQALRRLLDVQADGRRDLVRAALSNALEAVAVVEAVPGIDGGHYVVADILPARAMVTRLIREDRLHLLPAVRAIGGEGTSRDEAVLRLYERERITRDAALEALRDPRLLADARTRR